MKIMLSVALFAVALFHRFGLSYTFFVGLVFGAALILISFIDLDARIVPDVISLPGIAIGLLFSIIGSFFIQDSYKIIPTPLNSLIGILAGGGFLLTIVWGYEKITGVEGMGGGDIKLLAMIGAFLGWSSLPITLLVASALGLVIGISLILLNRTDRHLALPFAPLLCSGAFSYIFSR